ncbi:5'/3'-nucleotidase SurE [Tsukamurella spumae]|uniref:5'-nucleotidase n=1 Tax=Tsukamurella spumae TaxID=44753 RepID=A0A846X5P4_9ACTN|nr:5'/3'-nucleotidase SurE [Tsukamurella spumae]NKY20754.1 hypothetical protein [Tsukamurella spumae]
MLKKSLRAAVLLGAVALATTACGSTSDSAAPGPSAPSPSSSGATPAPVPTSVARMKILMFDDDSVQGVKPNGSDGLGLYRMRQALCRAGADVLVVGPWTVQSGQGSRLTLTGTATVQEVKPPPGFDADCAGAPSAGKVFGVCTSAAPCVAPSGTEPGSQSASPTDAANIALKKFIPDNYWKDGPDLVVSGINYGQNDAVNVVGSGTVNAALAAHRSGKPAIAVSEEATVGCLTSGTDCPEYTRAADFTVNLINQLAADNMITSQTFLNVNYPHLAPGEQPREPKLGVLGNCSSLNVGPTGTVGPDGGTYTLTMLPACKDTTANADVLALADKHISVVQLDGDWTAPSTSADNDKLEGVLRKVK